MKINRYMKVFLCTDKYTLALTIRRLWNLKPVDPHALDIGFKSPSRRYNSRCLLIGLNTSAVLTE